MAAARYWSSTPRERIAVRELAHERKVDVSGAVSGAAMAAQATRAK
jgi:hypothetical protein